MPIVHRSLTFDGNSIDVEKRTAQIVWTTGERVLRKNWGNEPVYEVLDMSPSSINLRLLNDKAPLLIDHNGVSVRNIVGVIEPGSALISNTQGHASVRFGSDPESENIFQKVRDGLISKVSVGYSIDKTERIRSKNKNEYDTIIVRSWTPHEVSLVVFPADPKAGVRSIEEEKFTLNEGEEKNMPNIAQSRSDELNKNEDVQSKIDSKEIKKMERERISGIEKNVRLANLDESFARKLIDEDVSLDEARAQIFQKMEDSHKQTPHIPAVTGGNPAQSIQSRNDSITTAILHRHDPKNNVLDESSARFRNSSLCDIARFISNGNAFDGKSEIVERALSTSDFPNLLANVLNKSLRREYEAAPKTYEPLVRRVTVPDFKPIKRVQMGDAPVLLEKSEHGQYQAGTFSDASESYAIREWGRLITLTRQMLINDDLSSMLRIPSMLARRAAELEADLAWNAILKNAVMGDGANLFDAKHNNLAKVPAPINVQSIAAAKTAMRMQKGLNGSRLNITPYLLITSSANEVNALQFMFPTTPNIDQNTNPYKTSLKLIIEPRLDDVNPNAWYLSADLGQIDLIEMAYLQGQEGLYMEQKIDFDTDGIRLKVRMDVEAKAIDWRGFYRNDGVSQLEKSAK